MGGKWEILFWGSSKITAGIPSPPPALFLVMLPEAHLTSIPGCLALGHGSWRSFLYSSSVYTCHLFLISSASVRFIPFLSFIEPIFVQNAPLVSLIFLRRSLVFPNLLFSSISLRWSLRKAFLSLLAILWNSAFKWICLPFSPLLFISLLFTAICKASSDSHFTSWQIDGEIVKKVADFVWGGSKITADGDCSHEIKRCLLLERSLNYYLLLKIIMIIIMTNLDSVLKTETILCQQSSI